MAVRSFWCVCLLLKYEKNHFLSSSAINKVSKVATVVNRIEETSISCDNQTPTCQNVAWSPRDSTGPPVYQVYNCLFLISSHSIKCDEHLFRATLEPIKVGFRTGFSSSLAW